jgi:phospholipase C
MENLEAAGLTWHSYIDTPSGAFRPSSGTWSICTYFSWCLKNRFSLAYTSPKSTFFDDAAAGRLPNLSYLLPVQEYSQHNNASMAVGDNYLGAVLDAVMSSRQWSSTAVFVTYDDCGCFYDHVRPPSGLGMRNPMVIISPWARRGYTDSTVAVQPLSVLSFVDHNFGLPALTPRVGTAYDYHRAFDFTQKPVAPIAMTRQHVSATTRERVRELSEKYGEDIT